MRKKWELDRRSFLVSAGGSMLALPFLEVMLPSIARSQAAGLNQPVFGAIFFGNGVNDQRWLPKSLGKMTVANTTGTTMEEFAKRGLLGHFSTMTGTCIYADPLAGSHPQDPARFLTGWYPPVVSRVTDRGGQGAFVNRESLDQYIARINGGKSYTTGIRIRGYTDGWTTYFNTHVSWKKDPNEASYNYQSIQNYDSPVEKVKYPTKIYADKVIEPSDLFDRIFPNFNPNAAPSGGGLTAKQNLRKTIVDLTYGDRNRIYNLVGSEDKQRLEGWFSEVHEHQKGLQGTNNQYGLYCPQNLGKDSNAKITTKFGNPNGTTVDNDNFEPHADAMFKTLKLGIQCGQVNNFTLMLTEGLNNNYYRRLFEQEYKSENIPSRGEHDFGHDFFNKTMFPKSDMVVHWIDRFHARMVANFLKDLKDTPMGENSMLHESLIMYGGALGNPSYHNSNSFPTLIAGNAKGQINMQGGRHINMADEAGVGAKQKEGNFLGNRLRPVSQQDAIKPAQGWAKHGNVLRAVAELCTGKSAAGQFNDNYQIDLKNLLK